MSEEQEHNGGPTESAELAAKKPAWWLHLLVVVGLLAVGVLAAHLLIKSKKPPEKVEQKTLAPLVEVQQLKVRDIQMVVRGFGTVMPKVQVELVPQVSGKVVYVHPDFKPGGFVTAGTKLLQIDPRDYELAVQQALAVVTDAQVQLDLETAEARVARPEWEDLFPNTEPTSPLVFREPQIRKAEARLKSAEAQLATAKLYLERTQLSLPVDAVIMTERVDLGQFVSTGQSIGAAYGIELIEIEVPLEDWELAWFSIPGNPVSPNGGSSCKDKTLAEVSCDFAGGEHVWTGYVSRTTGQVDRTSRLVSIVVEVPDPFKNSDSKPPLVPGMFVDVSIRGKILERAIAVPRDALHNGNEVWVVEDSHLRIRPLDIVRTDQGYAYATSGLEDGANIVLSALDTVTDGMAVRTQSENGANPAQAAAQDSDN
jgi:RND family efflux transporter MFP subunit